jgi:hypothetical protein
MAFSVDNPVNLIAESWGNNCESMDRGLQTWRPGRLLNDALIDGSIIRRFGCSKNLGLKNFATKQGSYLNINGGERRIGAFGIASRSSYGCPISSRIRSFRRNFSSLIDSSRIDCVNGGERGIRILFLAIIRPVTKRNRLKH